MPRVHGQADALGLCLVFASAASIYKWKISPFHYRGTRELISRRFARGLKTLAQQVSRNDCDHTEGSCRTISTLRSRPPRAESRLKLTGPITTTHRTGHRSIRGRPTRSKQPYLSRLAGLPMDRPAIPLKSPKESRSNWRHFLLTSPDWLNLTISCRANDGRLL
jgi:hypothetical protein